jgi:crooked neck
MVFKDDERESNPTSFKFLQMAHAWKAAKSKKPLELPKPTVKESKDGEDAASDVASSHGGD